MNRGFQKADIRELITKGNTILIQKKHKKELSQTSVDQRCAYI